MSKLSTIICDQIDKKERLHTAHRTFGGPFDSAVSTAYTLPLARETHIGQVAQLVEHVTENHGVGGSIPSLAIKDKRRATGMVALSLSSYSDYSEKI